MPSQKVASAYVDLQLQTAAFKASINEATSSMRQFSEQTRAEMNKSRESVRLLNEDIGLGLPRGLQSVISKMPGVSTAMNLAFDSVIVFALIDAVVKVTEKVEAFIKKNEEAAKKSADSWKEITKSVQGVNSELVISNARIQDSIAKLEAKPGDGVKTALLEAADAAQKLSDKLDQDIDKVLKLTTERKIGMLDELAGNGKDYLDTAIGSGATIARNVLASYQDVLRRAANAGDTKNYNATRQDEIQALQVQLTPALTTLAEYLRKNQNLAGGTDATFNKAKAGFDTLTGIIASAIEQSNDERGKQTQAGLQASKDSERDATEADKKALEQAKQRLADIKSVNDMSLQSEKAFWDAMAHVYTGGAHALMAGEATAVQDKITKQAGTDQTSYQFDWAKRSFEAQRKQISEQTPATLGETQEAMDKADAETAKNAQKAAEETYRNALEQIETDMKLKEEQIRLLVEQGRISKLAAALALQAIHSQAQSQWVSAWSAAENNGANLPLSEAEKRNAQFDSQTQVDDYATRINTVAGATVTALDKMATSFTDVATIVSTTLIKSINSFNDTLIHVLTTPGYQHRNAFTNLGKGIFTDVAKSGLQATEGEVVKGVEKIPGVSGVMDKLGLGGKKTEVTGTVSLSAATITALNLGHVAGSAAGTVAGLGGSASQAVSAISMAVGWMATGGVVSPGMYMTGEEGPELIQLGSTSRINNARDTSRMFLGTGISHQISIDARGANDPAAVNAAVHRAMAEYLPHMGNLAQQTIRDNNRRLPSSRRQ